MVDNGGRADDVEGDGGERAYRSYGDIFIGARGENVPLLRKLLDGILLNERDWRVLYDSMHNVKGMKLVNGRRPLASYVRDSSDVTKVVEEAVAMLDRYSTPWMNPRYMAQMNSDVSLPAVAAIVAGLLRNPNAVAHESSAASALMEEEVIRDLVKLFGFPEPGKQDGSPAPLFTREGPFGHLTGDGTLANTEAMMVMRDLKAFPVAVKNFLEMLEEEGKKKDIAPKDEEERKRRIGVIESAIHGIRSMDQSSLLNLPLDAILDAIGAIVHGGILSDVLRQSIRYSGMHDIDIGKVLVSSARHYSVEKAMSVLGIGVSSLVEVPVDGRYRMSVAELEKRITSIYEKGGRVLAVIAIVGTTEEGAVDDVRSIADLREKFAGKGIHFFVHVDAAYGGYFRTLYDSSFAPSTPLETYLKDVFDSIKRCDSLTIDPHKRIYVPYSVGGIVVRDRRMLMLSLQRAPYLFHDSRIGVTERNVGQVTLEGTRSGAMIAGVWAAHRSAPLDGTGYGRILKVAKDNVAEIGKMLMKNLDGAILPSGTVRCSLLADPPDLDIMDYAFNFDGNASLKDMNHLNELVTRFYGTDMEPPSTLSFLPKDFVLAENEMPESQYGDAPLGFLERMGVKGWNDDDKIVLVRTVYMHPWPVGHDLINELESSLRETLNKSIMAVKAEKHFSDFASRHGFKYDPVFHGKDAVSSEQARMVEDESDARIIKVVLLKAGSGGGRVGAILADDERADLAVLSSLSGMHNLQLVDERELASRGLMRGGLSPLYLAEHGIPTWMDSKVSGMEKVVGSAGTPSVGMRFTPGDLVKAFGVNVADIAEHKN